MVWSVIKNVEKGLKYRGGWRGLLEHMYTNGDFPFKFGTYMGSDGAGNRYYENRVDYPFGQHRWVEPGDINNFDSSSIPPEWQGWMTSMNDATPETEEDYFNAKIPHTLKTEVSSVSTEHNIGKTEKLFNFHHMHNQSQVRSRGFNIGNPIVNLPPGVPDGYYTQPGSPYNPASIRKFEMIGDLDEANGGGRPFKSDKWAERLMTAEEKVARSAKKKIENKKALSSFQEQMLQQKITARSRGGTIVGK